MAVSNINDITTETNIEAIAIDDLENLILNAIKSDKNIIKLPDCSLVIIILVNHFTIKF